MKGLVYKDLSLIGRQGKFLFVYLLVFVLIFSAVGDGASTVTSFLSVVCFMLSINCFAYDEQCGFGKLVAASPLRPLRVALSRYLSALVLGLGGCLLTAGVSSVVQLVKRQANFPDLAMSMGLAVCMDLLFMAVTFPLFFKFGVNKSRLLLLVIVAIPAALVAFLSTVAPESLQRILTPERITWLVAGGIVLLVLLVVGSVFLSGKILEKKAY